MNYPRLGVVFGPRALILYSTDLLRCMLSAGTESGFAGTESGKLSRRD